MLCIAVDDFYHKPEYYRFMPESIFSALEKAFLEGEKTAIIPEKDYIKMITEININNGVNYTFKYYILGNFKEYSVFNNPNVKNYLEIKL